MPLCIARTGILYYYTAFPVKNLPLPVANRTPMKQSRGTATIHTELGVGIYL